MKHLVNYEINKSTNYSESIDNVVFVKQSSMNQISNFFKNDQGCLITDQDCNDVIELYERLSTHPNPGLVVRSIYRSICKRIYEPVNLKKRMSEYLTGETPMYSQYSTTVSPNKISDVCIVDKDINLVTCLFLLITDTTIDIKKKHHEVTYDSFKSIETKLNNVMNEVMNKLDISYSVVH